MSYLRLFLVTFGVAILGYIVTPFIITDPIWAINVSTIAGVLAGVGYYWYMQRAEEERIDELVDEG